MPDSIAVVAGLAAVAIKASLLIALAAAAAWALRGASAAVRHALWSAVLFGVLVIAGLAPLPVSWSFPLRTPPPIPALARGASIAESANASMASVTPVAAQPGILPRLTGLILVAWALGVAMLALRTTAGVLSLRRITRRGRTITTGSMRTLLDTTCRRVRLIESDDVQSPATWRVWRPVIALPTAARAWSAASLETALRHEVAHVRRRDVVTQLMAEAGCALLWFHPAIWFAAARMRAERERACDDAVLVSGASEIDYAASLVAVAAGVSRPARGAVGMASASGLESRIRAILNPAVRRGGSRRVLVSVSAGVLIATLGVAGLDVLGAAPDGASADLASSERIPLTAADEERALHRSFKPRDEREAQAIARLFEGAAHVKEHEMDFVRDRAVWALSIAHDDEVVAPLVAELSSKDWRARAAAAWCLDVVGAGQAAGKIRELLTDPVWRVRAMAAEALVDLGDMEPGEDVLSLLEDPAWQVRMPAVELASRVHTPESAAMIRARLKDPHVAVRLAAQAAVGRIPTR